MVVQEACHRHFLRESLCENKNCKNEKNGMSTFDENPYAFRKVLPLRAQSLNTKCSTSGDLLRVHSDADFDENPRAILRFVHWHRNVILAAMECTYDAS